MFVKMKKFSVALVLVFFILSSFFGSLVVSVPSAQAAGIPVVDLPALGDRIKDIILKVLKVGALQGASSAVSYTLKKFTYDTAVWLASGGKGQSPLAQSKGFGDYLSGVAGDAFGKAMEQISASAGLGAAGLCSVPDPKIDLALRTGVRISLNPGNTYNPVTKPACNFNQFVKNWGSADTWKSRFSNVSGSVQQQFNQALSFKVEEGGSLGVQIGAINAINQKLAQAEKAGILQRQEGGGFNDLVSPISGQVKTPAKLIQKEFEGITSGEGAKRSAQQIDTAIATGEFSILPGALARFFVDTLAGTALKNYQKNGVLPFGIGGGSLAVNYEDAGILGGRIAAQNLFNNLLTAQVNSVDQYNILAQLSSCPDNPGVYNCRADSGLVQAAQEIGNGSPTTIKEALDKGWLHANYPLLPPSRGGDDADPNCYNRAYCFSNIKVLRQLRVLPLGFEIAALNSDPDKPWTLAQVVNGFNDCRYDNGVLVYDPVSHPFCHLIDPNWVIRAFPTRCNAMSYGPSLLGAVSGDRLEDCSDLSTCVGYNKDGTCINYAYCTREKNTWRFAADECSPQYESCRSFVDSKGNPQSYLYRTLDTGSCNQDNVGCSAYSLTPDAKGGWVTPTGAKTYNGVNTGIYFNSKVSASCSANSAGCSAFQLASGDMRYIKKAPDALRCYDADQTTVAIDWPKTTADLARVKGAADCSQYAGVCIPDEISCNWYQSQTRSADKIPGRFRPAQVENNQVVWNDQCDGKCVGYAGYREMPNNYSNGQNLAYIIPSSGKTCSASEEGCTSFTNLTTTSGGVEKTEYFSYLRSCSLPDTAAQKNFITYEGSSVNGFQLKTFTLLKDETGAPKYSYRTAEDLAQYEAVCNETLYKAGQATPDCRQFNDAADASKVYYRLLAKTIVVSSDCTPYRLNTTDLNVIALDETQCKAQKGFWDQGKCQVCFQGGEFRDGACYYYGLPGGVRGSAGSSVSCSAIVNTCRAYKGSLGNNIKVVVNDGFEKNAPTAGWSGNVALSQESTQVGGHSLRSSGANPASKSLVVSPGKTYDLTFWAKGDTGNLKISLTTEQTNSNKDFGTVVVGDTWNYYHLGPVELSGSGTQAQLLFTSLENKTVFLDNVHLSEGISQVYLVKNTLTVNPLCDSHPDDNLPGEALGCSAYTDSKNNTFYLTNFSYLCREGAIGCTAVFDTKNTPTDPLPKAYNVWLKGSSGTVTTATINGQKFSCQVTVGETGCYTNIFGIAAQDIITALGNEAWSNSTTYIPPDTDSKSPVYLVASESGSCNAVDLGCTLAGLEVKTPTGPKYNTVLIKNDPATYDQTLCQVEAVGCNQFNSGSSQLYFKDPQAMGQKICAYKTNVAVGNNKTNGWFWKDVGVCSNNAATLCTANADCGAQNTCTQVGNQPCYPSYIQQGASFGLWSYGDKGKYNNFVGECAAEQDKCTQFIDHNDGDQAYYFIKNDKLTGGDCNGSVSQKTGCALFDEAANPNKYWSSDATYAASEKINSGPVNPVAAGNPNENNSNVILKVDRDRECGEWLQCQSSHRVWDQQLGKWKNVCDAIGRCDKLPTDALDSNATNCADWVDSGSEDANQILTPDAYSVRDVSWKGKEYAGYSLLNFFPIEELSQINVSSDRLHADWRLGKVVACGGINCLDGKPNTDLACKTSNAPCGRGSVGVCINGSCLVGANSKAGVLNSSLTTQSCRAYPEKDSPFPNTPFVVKSQQFNGARLCQETKQKNPADNAQSDPQLAYKCECDYTKAEYGDGIIKYWDSIAPNSGTNPDDILVGASGPGPVSGICLGGQKDGNVCKTDDDCYKEDKSGKVVDGSCQKLKRQSTLIGWKGFCLEQDLSRVLNGDKTKHPCLTWLPVDSLVGGVDLNNLYPKAGYQLTEKGGKFFCLQANVPDAKSLAAIPPVFMSTEKNDSKYGSWDKSEISRNDIPANQGNIYKEDIERIDFQVLDSDTEDPVKGMVFSVWPNDLTINKPQAAYNLDKIEKDDFRGVVTTGHYMNSENQMILVYGSSSGQSGIPDYLDVAGNVCFGKDKNTVPGKCMFGGNIFETDGLMINGKYHVLSGVGDALSLATPEQKNNKDGIWNPAWSNFSFCTDSGDEDVVGRGNWHALRVDFDEKTRRFMGFKTIYCDKSNDGGEITYRVSFKMRQTCTAFAETKVDLGSPTAAWTNRIWLGSKNKFPALPDLGYVYNSDTAPYGSMEMADLPITTWDKDFLNSVGSSVVMTPFEMQKDQTGKCNGMNDVDCTFADSIKNAKNQFVVGAPYSCNNGDCIQVRYDSKADPLKQYISEKSAAAGRTFDQAVDSLHKIFARVFATHYYTKQVLPGGMGRSFWRVDDPVYKNDLQSDFKTVSDVTETAEKIPKTPIVLPVGNCNSSDDCLENIKDVGFTINDRSNDDVKIFTNTGRVFLKFFGYADSDHMPLRQVKIDWGDGGTPTQYSGLYRNHRGLSEATCVLDTLVGVKKCQVSEYKDFFCATNSDCTPSFGAGSTCDTRGGINRCLAPRFLNQNCTTDDDCTAQPVCVSDQAKAENFGQLLDTTCENNYFQFDHTFRCNLKDVRPASECGSNPALYPNGCCKFKPKVQLKDNWGWYNGVCTPGHGQTGKGCYSLPDGSIDDGDNPGAWIGFSNYVLVAPKIVR